MIQTAILNLDIKGNLFQIQYLAEPTNTPSKRENSVIKIIFYSYYFLKFWNYAKLNTINFFI